MSIATTLVLGTAIALSSAGASQALSVPFDIQVNFTGGLSASQQAIFTAAETFWESRIFGYLEDPSPVLPVLEISASGVAIDGVGGVLGSAGPQTAAVTASYYYTKTGAMQFDTADLSAMEAGGTLLDVVKHEMAHVIGLGTLWALHGLYVDGTGQYTGAKALAAYKAEFDPLATYVPVELDGGAGTANGHWDETWAGGTNELMTGYLNAPTFVSNTTIQSFADLGYDVAAVPLPATGLLLIGAFGGLAVARRRKAA